MRGLVAALLGLTLLGAAHAQAPAAAAQALTPVEQAGRRLYHEGIDAAGRALAARVAGSPEPLKGKAMACGNCHGEDGHGRAESGVDPGNVTWSELTKPYGHLHANNRRHGPYDAASLRRALRAGTDPAGNALEPAMPRYDLADADVDALVAYLKRLEAQRDAGISDEAIRIGTVLPAAGPLSEAGRAVQRVLEGYFENINGRGGVHGRRLKLVVAPLVDGATGARNAVQGLLQKDPVFALLAPLSALHEREFAGAAEGALVPVIGPLTLFPEGAAASSTYVFHVLPGVPELAEALAVYLHPVLALGGRAIVLLHAASDDGRATARAVEARLRERGYAAFALEPLGAPAELAERVQRHQPGAVIVLAPGGNLTAAVQAVAATGIRPHWLLPAPLMPADILDWTRAADGRIFLAYPTLPQDRTPLGRVTYEAAVNNQPARGHQAMEIAALSSAIVMVEGLSRAGRDLSRRKFVTALEGLQGFDTGLTPRISYNADRRIGSYGAYIVKVDLDRRAFQPVPDFVRLQ